MKMLKSMSSAVWKSGNLIINTNRIVFYFNSALEIDEVYLFIVQVMQLLGKEFENYR